MSEPKKYATFRDLRSLPVQPRAAEASTSIPSTTSISSITGTPSSTSAGDDKKIGTQKARQSQVSPERDFQRIPNSITRKALAEGIFKGKSKQVWDYLWSVSRGAINPTRTVRKSRSEIKSGSGLGSMVTVDAAITHLRGIGFIEVKTSIGSLKGNEYEVFTPEEAVERYTSTSSISSSTSLTQKVVVLDAPESSISRITQPSINTTTSEEFKTLSKTDDDETHTLWGLVEALGAAARSVVGGKFVLTEKEREHWKEVGLILAAELKSASERTEAISSVPAFFAAHLRRRFARREMLSPPQSSRPTTPQAEMKAHTVTRANAKTASITAEKGSVENPEAKSKFTLKQCREWAEHLHKTGQGSTDPGGLAYKRFMDGTADELIEEFINPPPSPPDKSQCPDCGGKGYYFPDPTKPETQRCTHERLQTLAGKGTGN